MKESYSFFDETAAAHLAEQADTISDLSSSRDVQLRAAQYGIDKRHNPSQYWGIVADIGEEQSSQLYEAGKLSAKAALARQIITRTPEMFCLQEQMTAHSFPSGDAFRLAKERLSYYNSLIRSLAVSDESLKANDIARSILVSAGSTLHTPQERLIPTAQQIIRGAQHEIGFAKILSHTSLTYREATLEEDLKGSDLVLINGDDEIGFDVKASLDKVAATRGGYEDVQPFVRKRDGSIVGYSCLQDADFKGYMNIPDDIAQQRAVYVESALTNLLKIA